MTDYNSVGKICSEIGQKFGSQMRNDGVSMGLIVPTTIGMTYVGNRFYVASVRVVEDR